MVVKKTMPIGKMGTTKKMMPVGKQNMVSKKDAMSAFGMPMSGGAAVAMANTMRKKAKQATLRSSKPRMNGRYIA